MSRADVVAALRTRLTAGMPAALWTALTLEDGTEARAEAADVLRYEGDAARAVALLRAILAGQVTP